MNFTAASSSSDFSLKIINDMHIFAMNSMSEQKDLKPLILPLAYVKYTINGKHSLKLMPLFLQ